MRGLISLLCAASIMLQPLYAEADEQVDATTITEQLLSDEVIEATFGAIGTIMGDVMIAEFKKTGVEISDEASVLLADMLLNQMVDQMGPALRETQREIYVETLSAEELRDFVIYLESPSGQAVAAMQSILVSEGARRGELLGVEIAPSLLGYVVEDLEAGQVPLGASQKAFDELVALMSSK